MKEDRSRCSEISLGAFAVVNASFVGSTTLVAVRWRYVLEVEPRGLVLEVDVRSEGKKGVKNESLVSGSRNCGLWWHLLRGEGTEDQLGEK